MGPKIQWIQSYVAGDRIYCVYYSTDPELIREHANRGGFPANRITEIATIIEPVTSEAKVATR
jgi:hypothetical protein